MTLFSSCNTKKDNTTETSTHTHVYSNTYVGDSTGHYKVCECGDKIDLINHSFKEYKITLEATEISSGLKEHSCIVCNYKETEEIPALDHQFSNWNVTKIPTDENTGIATRICVNDGKIDTLTLPVLSDSSYQLVTSTPATCLSLGSETYSYLIDNEEITFDVELPYSNHDYSELSIVTKPSSDSEGTLEKECMVCHTKKTYTVPKLISDNVSIDKYEYSIKTAPTCINKGIGVYSITLESDRFDFDVELPETNIHNFSDTLSFNENSHFYKCITEECSEMIVEAHTFSEYSLKLAPTKTTEGSIHRNCNKCQYEDDLKLSSLNDSTYETEVLKETKCYEEGSIKYIFKINNQIFEFISTISKINHNYSSWYVTVNPTKTQKGLIARVCINDGCNKQEKLVLPTLSTQNGYAYSLISSASCSNIGKEEYSIEKNGNTFKFIIEIEKLEHIYEGYQLNSDGHFKICTICGLSTDVESHSFAEVYEMTSKGHYHFCNICNAQSTLEEHTYKWEVQTSPSINSNGLLVHNCSTCYYSDSKNISISSLSNSNYDEDHQIKVESTCKTEGSITYLYTIDSEDIVVASIKLDKIEHKIDLDDIKIVSPTYTNSGTLTSKCIFCGEIILYDLPILTNSSYIVEKINSTCTIKGKINYYYKFNNDSSITNILVSTITLDLVEHTYNEYEIEILPTNTEVGNAIRECCVCSNKDSYELPLVNDSNYIINSMVKSTCTEKGKIIYNYKIESQTLEFSVELELDLSNHNYGKFIITIEPTHISVGSAKKVCSNCCHEDFIELPILDDTSYLYQVTKENTCTEEGEETYTYTYNKDSFDEEVFVITKKIASVHNYSNYEITKEPSSYNTGLLSRKCSGCGNVDNYTLPSLQGLIYYDEVYVKPTCINPGLRKYTLKEKIDGQTISFEWNYEPTGHQYTYIITTYPTLDSVGELTKSCKNCDIKETIILETLSEDNGYILETYVEATCAKPGSEKFSIEIESNTYTFSVTLNQLEHSYVDEVCSVCGSSDNLVYKLISNKYFTISGITSSTLKNVVIPAYYNNLMVIGIASSAFYNNTTIKSIRIQTPDFDNYSIGSYAFSGCTSLETFIMPEIKCSLYLNAFDGCTSLKTLVLYSANSQQFLNGTLSIENVNILYKGTTSSYNSWINLQKPSIPNTTIVYFFSATKPTVEGNYWYYDSNNNPTIWE